MTKIANLQTSAAREALKILEEAYTYFAPEQTPVVRKDAVETDAYIPYFEAA